MSEQVTNVDIDDVLSSIRRLVSEGGQKSSVESSDAGKGPKGPEKLILTPNFRVKDSKTSQDSQPDDISEVAETVNRTSAPVDAGPAALVLKPEQSIPVGQDQIDISRATLEATIAELEAQVSEKGEDWEPDGSEVAEEVTWASAGFVAANRDEETSEKKETSVEEDDAPTDRLPSMEAVESTIASAMIAEAFDEIKEDSSETDYPADIAEAFVARPRAHRWSEEAERRLTPVIEEESDFDDELATPTQISNDDQLEQYLNQGAMFDEATLKRVVQEVVREELQGNLGERITRNVRKLVRREIHNILTTQEFE